MTMPSTPSPDRAVYVRALVTSAIMLAAISLAAAGIAAAVADSRTVWAALLGGAVAALAGLATPAAMLLGHDRTPAALAGIVAFTWLGKMLVIAAVVVVLSRVEGFPREAFGLTLLVGVVASLAVDLWAVRRTRVPYVDPGSNSRPQ